MSRKYLTYYWLIVKLASNSWTGTTAEYAGLVRRPLIRRSLMMAGYDGLVRRTGTTDGMMDAYDGRVRWTGTTTDAQHGWVRRTGKTDAYDGRVRRTRTMAGYDSTRTMAGYDGLVRRMV